MKSVLISIQPKWCELIASGKKTVEVRKTKPKLETPFKVYIYCTKNKEKLIEVIHEGDEVYGFIHKGKPNFIKTVGENWTIYGVFKGGKVIGEFVCDTFIIDKTFGHDALFNAAACLSDADAASYCLNKEMYGWHISDLVIYDKPKELEDFYVLKKCNSCRDTGYESTACCYDEDCRVPAVITRPPQSWCYCEEGEKKNDL